jgi:hypothetical protein
MARVLDSGYLYRIRTDAWLIKPVIAREALSLYTHEERPTFLFVGRTSDMKTIIHEMQENTAHRKKPVVKKVA